MYSPVLSFFLPWHIVLVLDHLLHGSMVLPTYSNWQWVSWPWTRYTNQVIFRVIYTNKWYLFGTVRFKPTHSIFQRVNICGCFFPTKDITFYYHSFLQAKDKKIQFSVVMLMDRYSSKNGKSVNNTVMTIIWHFPLNLRSPK